MKAVQCGFLIKGVRWGRNVVEQTRCKRKTTHPSGRCFDHRSWRDETMLEATE